MGRIRTREQARHAERWLKDQDARRRSGESVHPRYDEVVHELLIFDWTDGAPPLSEHARLGVAASAWIGKPLEPGQPVPGCSCEACTGVPARNAAVGSRVRPADDRPRGKGRAENRDSDRSEADRTMLIDRARSVPIMEVARRLGIVTRHGWAPCPFHDDTNPSFHLNEKKNAAFCNPCGRSWDGIALTMEMGNMKFMDAVKEIAA